LFSDLKNRKIYLQEKVVERFYKMRLSLYKKGRIHYQVLCHHALCPYKKSFLKV
jgi:hypothetical protein